MQKKILITGFDPFGGEKINPSWEAVKLLPDFVGDYQIVKLQIPTVFGKAARTVLEKAQEVAPDAIVCVGQAGGRAAVTPEVIGINLIEANIADNEGNQPCCVPVVDGGAAAYFATLPVREMVAKIKSENLPSALSFSAGAFVCNELLYTLLRSFDGTKTRVGFIHVPFLPEQAKPGIPSMKIDDIVRALTLALSVL